MKEILVEKILVKKFLMTKINFFSTYINIMKNYLTIKEIITIRVFKDPRAIKNESFKC